MKDKKRSYRMNARARSATETRERIIAAAVSCFSTRPFDVVSLRDIAREAKVSLPTVVRVADSKEALFALATATMLDAMGRDLASATVADSTDAVRFVVDLLEVHGDALVLLMAHETRSPVVRSLFDAGRTAQIQWIEQHYGRTLDPLDPATRKRRIAALLTATGARSWFVLRRIHALSADETATAMGEMIAGLLAEPQP